MARVNNKIYALYKGDELMCEGTVREIAKQMNLTSDHVYKMKTPKIH